MSWAHRKGGHESAATRKKISASEHRHTAAKEHKPKAKSAPRKRSTAAHRMKTSAKTPHHKITKSEVLDTSAFR